MLNGLVLLLPGPEAKTKLQNLAKYVRFKTKELCANSRYLGVIRSYEDLANTIFGEHGIAQRASEFFFESSFAARFAFRS